MTMRIPAELQRALTVYAVRESISRSEAMRRILEGWLTTEGILPLTGEGERGE